MKDGWHGHPEGRGKFFWRAQAVVAPVRAAVGGDVGWPFGRGSAPPSGPAGESTPDSLITLGTRIGKGSLPHALAIGFGPLDGGVDRGTEHLDEDPRWRALLRVMDSFGVHVLLHRAQEFLDLPRGRAKQACLAATAGTARPEARQSTSISLLQYEIALGQSDLRSRAGSLRCQRRLLHSAACGQRTEERTPP